jgi:hypothetical protein
MNSIQPGNHVLYAPASDPHVFLIEIHVFLQLSFIGQFGANRASLHNENCDFQEVFLKKSNSMLTWKQCATAAACTIGSFLSRDTFVYSTQLNRLIWKKGALLYIEKYDLQEVFLSKKRLNSHTETMC